jgi:hypothetical protein
MDGAEKPHTDKDMEILNDWHYDASLRHFRFRISKILSALFLLQTLYCFNDSLFIAN